MTSLQTWCPFCSMKLESAWIRVALETFARVVICPEHGVIEANRAQLDTELEYHRLRRYEL